MFSSIKYVKMGFAASHFYLYESGAKGEKFPIPVNELQFS